MLQELQTPRRAILIAFTSLAGVSVMAILCAAMRHATPPESNFPIPSSPPRSSLARPDARRPPHPDGEVGELVRTEPVEALCIAIQLEASPQRDEILRRAVAEWSVRNGEAAFRWISAIADPVLRDELCSVAVVHFADHDPAAAAEILASHLPPGTARGQALMALYQRWAQIDPAAAHASAVALPDFHERVRALEQVVRQLATDDPSGAIRMVVDDGLEEALPDLIEELTTRWAILDLTAAQEWLELQPQSEIRDRLVKQAAAVVARQNPSRAAEVVLESIPPGMTQDEAILAVLGEWLLSDIDAASGLAKTFPPGSLRRRADDEVRKAILRRSPP